MVSSTVVWTIVGIVSIVLLAAVLTTAVLLVERNKAKPASNFSCSLATPSASPDCAVSTINVGIPGPLRTGFFTAPDLQVLPTSVAMTSLQEPLPLTGYYHAHPTAYFTQSPGGVIYSYPFVLQAGGSTLHLAAYNYATIPREVASAPYEQYAYAATGLDTALTGYTLNLPCISSLAGLKPDFEPYTMSNSFPTLSSTLSTTDGNARMRVVLNQGTPFMTIIFGQATVTTPSVQIMSMTDFSSSDTTQITVSTPVSHTFNAYIFWSNRSGTPHRCIVWFVDASIAQQLDITNDVATLRIPAQTNMQMVVYVSMFAQTGPLLAVVMQTLANSLVPHYINLADVIPTSSNTAMQYTLQQIPGITVGQNFQSGTSTIWIVPPTSFQVAALAAITLPGADYFDFPLGNGLFQTNARVGLQDVNFFTIWPKPIDSIRDFSYALTNLPSSYRDTSAAVATDTDLYNLALAIRILFLNPAGQAPSDIQINSAVSTLVTKLGELAIGLNDHSLFTTQLGEQDAGLLSRVSNLVLTFLHLNAISDRLPNSRSANGWLTESRPKIVMLIESGLTTTSLGQQSFKNVGLYTPMPFIDTYSCTAPVIKTAGLPAVPAKGLPQLTSRLGEVLGYFWACDNLVSNNFVSAAPASAYFARALYSITLEATSRLLRGQCTASSTPTLAPVMPWTSLISQSAIGFEFDGSTPAGSSPDSALLQSFLPFTPASHHSVRPLLAGLTIAVEKLLRCSQSIPQAQPAKYEFNSYVDSILVGYFAYLYTIENRSHMLISGKVDPDLAYFVKFISLQHPSVALLMNQVKLLR
jgi:hypothetical protein